jgi:hypothetical protein
MGYDTLNATALQLLKADLKAIWRSEPLLGGLNNRVGPQYLSDQQASVLENVDLKDPSRPKVRDGYATIGSAQTDILAALLDNRINSLGVLSPTGATATSMFITIPDAGSGRTYRTTDTTTGWDDALTVAPDATPGQQYDPGAAEDIPTAQLADCYYLLGSTPAAIDTANGVVRSSNTDDILGTAGSPPHNGVDICSMLGRGWIFTNACILCYSKFNPAAATINSDWARLGIFSPTTGAGRLEVSPNSSQVARGLLPWNETSLLLFYDNSIEQVVVSITDPFTDSARRVIEPRFGLIARRAKAVLGQEVFFMDQYGSVRTLGQTVNAEQSGVASLPLSEAIAAELPGRLNFAAASKVHFVIKREKLYVYFPRDTATQCNARAVYNLAYRMWESIDLLGHAHGHAVVSDIRGDGANGFEMFVTNGESSGTVVSRVYRTDTGSYTDAGSTIVYREYGKALTFGSPEAEKLYAAVEAGFIGDQGVEVQVVVQVDEAGITEPLAPNYVIPVTGTSDFPLTSSSFPLLPSSFPLVDTPNGITRNLWRLTDVSNGLSGRGRMIRFGFQTETTTAGLEFQRAEFWATARPLPRKEME